MRSTRVLEGASVPPDPGVSPGLHPCGVPTPSAGDSQVGRTNTPCGLPLLPLPRLRRSSGLGAIDAGRSPRPDVGSTRASGQFVRSFRGILPAEPAQSSRARGFSRVGRFWRHVHISPFDLQLRYVRCPSFPGDNPRPVVTSRANELPVLWRLTGLARR